VQQLSCQVLELRGPLLGQQPGQRRNVVRVDRARLRGRLALGSQRFQRDAAHPPLIAAVALVQQDRPQPGAKAEMRIVAGARLERREKRLLHDVPGPVDSPQTADRDTSQRRLIAPHQLCKTLRLAALDARHQGSVRRLGFGIKHGPFIL
jgi:hypothetical protein